ncbi:hypothetical protein ACKVMT_17070 [Halobacteriales archaeon Cl-PHB]
MTRLTRRRTLRATGLALGLGLAGCLRGSGNDGDGDGSGNGVTVTGTSAFQLGSPGDTPDWAESDAAGTARLFASPDAARQGVALDRFDVDGDALQRFLDQADHEAIQLVYVETVGPNTCYTTVTPSAFTAGGGSLEGTLTATKPEDAGDACGEAITYSAALVQVLYSGQPPQEGSLTVVSGGGSETTVDVSVGGN